MVICAARAILSVKDDWIDFRYGARAGGEKCIRVRLYRGLVIGPFHTSVCVNCSSAVALMSGYTNKGIHAAELPAYLLFVPTGSECQPVVEYDPEMLKLLCSGFRVDIHVAEPLAFCGRTGQLITIGRK